MHKVRLAVRENVLADPLRVQPAHYRAMLEEHGQGWVYEVDGEIVGFAIADHTRRSIWALFVAPDAAGHGIGRKLHDAMIGWLFEKGSEPVWLGTEPNTRAAKFYAAAGWRHTRVESNGEQRFELTSEAAASNALERAQEG
jgi:GNAT superfamily N-acetyltransferase